MKQSISIRGLMQTVAVAALVVSPALAQAASADPVTSGVAGQPSSSTAAQQDAQDPDIIVTGIRKSVASAIALKRNSDTISDSIVAQDIGRFPEQNLAESLQRITGIQIQRTNGEGQYVSVRGLDPKFTQVNLEGRAVPSALSGAGASSRNFDFTILSSDFVRSVTVEKTPTAELNEGGLAGSASVHLIDPLAVTERSFNISARGIVEQYKGGVQPRVAAIYQDSLADGKLGVVLGGYYSKRETVNLQYAAYGMQPFSDASHVNGPATKPYSFDNAQYFNENRNKLERLSALGGLSYKFSPSFNVYSQFLYSRFAQTNLNIADAMRYVNNSAPQCSGNPIEAITYSTIGNPPIATTLDSKCVDNRNNNRYNYNRATLMMASGGFNWNTDHLAVNVDASWGRSRNENTNYALEVIGRANVASTIGGGPARWVLDPGYNPLDPSSFNALGFNGAIAQPTQDTIKQAKFSATYKPDSEFLKSITFGARYADETNSANPANVTVNAQTTAALLGVPYNPNIETGGSLPAANFLSTYSRNFFGNNLTFLGADINKVFAKASLASFIAASPPVANLAGTYSVNEKDLALWIRSDFAIPSINVRGNVGLRAVNTAQTANGYAPDLTQIVYSLQGSVTTIPNVRLISVKQNYWEFLPNLNLSWSATDKLTVRFGAARTMTRPDLGTSSGLAPNTSVNANVNTISQGNPQLKPYTANQVDLSLEWYLTKESIFSVAGFYKDVSGFIQQQTTNQTLTVNIKEGGTQSVSFAVQKPVNATSTIIKGLEVNLQQSFGFVSNAFRDFGSQFIYTYVSGDPVQVSSGGPKLPLTGLSKNNFSAIGYYEDNHFGVRLAYTYRSAYVIDNISYFGDGDYRKSYGQLDASVNVHVLKNIDLTAEVTNLTNSKTINRDVYGINRLYEQDGRIIMFGARAKF